MSQLFAWGGQSTGVSALASFLPKKSQGWSPSEWTGYCEYIAVKTITSTLIAYTLNHTKVPILLYTIAFISLG